MTLRTLEEVKKEIPEKMVTPRRRLELIVDPLPDANAPLVFPFQYSLQRISA